MNTCVYVLLARYLWVQRYCKLSVPARNNACAGIQFTCHTDNIIIISHRNHRNHRKAMRHDYPHAETQRARSSRREFIISHRKRVLTSHRSHRSHRNNSFDWSPSARNSTNLIQILQNYYLFNLVQILFNFFA